MNSWMSDSAVEFGTSDAISKELLSLAANSTLAQRYKPGFVLHVKNALHLGAGGRAVRETLDIAAAAPAHRCVG